MRSDTDKAQPARKPCDECLDRGGRRHAQLRRTEATAASVLGLASVRECDKRTQGQDRATLHAWQLTRGDRPTNGDAITGEGNSASMGLDSPGACDVVGDELALQQPTTACDESPRLNVRSLKMLGQCFVARPELGESDEARIERILGDVIRDASVVLAGCVHQHRQVRKHFLHPVGRKAKNPKNCDGGSAEASHYLYSAAEMNWLNVSHQMTTVL